MKLHWHHTAGGYRVLEFPRGPDIGAVRCVGVLRWIGSDDCGDIGEARTRVAAAKLVEAHYYAHLRGRA